MPKPTKVTEINSSSESVSLMRAGDKGDLSLLLGTATTLVETIVNTSSDNEIGALGYAVERLLADVEEALMDIKCFPVEQGDV